MSVLSGKNLGVAVRDRQLIEGIDFELRAGELTGIIGANGAGKSTLLKALAGLLPCSGRIMLDGRPLQTHSPSGRACRIAYLAQGHSAHWPLPVREVVALGRLPHGRGNGPEDAAIVDRVLRATDALGLAERNVLTLSGGERARVMLARALAVEPKVLLADEPLAALDPAHQISIMQLFAAKAAAGLAIGVVLHDLTLAARFCSRLVLLHEGRVLAAGTPREVFDDALLAEAFGIRALHFEHGGLRLPIPWQLTGKNGKPAGGDPVAGNSAAA
ncbi:ABC transporter ATP-binding protein [Thauera sp. Sel9]|uniref:ABC transporter ATP-binding protein n=1 Tax=Thauera sp. Sel9 TaxID=2974299 RepID=UPI0021E153F4|nr:ABC transporter ATP-binding protein [Thauera sp. Sel9]MCV2219640.1 ABC transporter ATP-binding protein [Thauera sp. Sel9]